MAVVESSEVVASRRVLLHCFNGSFVLMEVQSGAVELVALERLVAFRRGR